MSKIRCRQCDICGVYIDERDFQFRIRRKNPLAVHMGVPIVGMKKLEFCEECGIQLQVQVELAVKNAREGRKEE